LPVRCAKITDDPCDGGRHWLPAVTKAKVAFTAPMGLALARRQAKELKDESSYEQGRTWAMDTSTQTY
jgi:hypothetical protein